MPLRELHERIAAIALRASGQHGFALGGGNALIAHGVISRPTQDIDLVTNVETGVGEAAGPLEAALLEAGYRAERHPRDSDLEDLFPGLGMSWPSTTSPAPAATLTCSLRSALSSAAPTTVITSIRPRCWTGGPPLNS